MLPVFIEHDEQEKSLWVQQVQQRPCEKFCLKDALLMKRGGEKIIDGNFSQGKAGFRHVGPRLK